MPVVQSRLSVNSAETPEKLLWEIAMTHDNEARETNDNIISDVDRKGDEDGETGSNESIEEVICPNCQTKLSMDEVGVMMFSSAYVLMCPVCKKTMAFKPRFDQE